MTHDRDELHRYVNEQAEDAFAVLVDRYFDMVWSTALRITRNEALANDVAQEVFTDLARRAPALGKNVILRGWLYRAAVFAAKNVNRREMRRTRREREAIAWHCSNEGFDGPDPEDELLENLDLGLQALSEKDRNLILLRFFGKKRLGAIAKENGVSYEATQKQVSRALARLKAWCAGQGVISTHSTLVASLTALGSQAAPVGLAAQVAQQSLLHASATSPVGLVLMKLNTKIMTYKTSLVVAGVSVAGVAPLALQELEIRAHETELKETRALVAELDDVPALHQKWQQALRDFQTYQGLLRNQNERDELRKEFESLKANGVDKLAGRLANLRALETDLDLQSQQWAALLATESAKQDDLIRMSTAKNLALPVVMYLGENEGRFPSSLSDLMVHMEKDLSEGEGGQKLFQWSPLDEWELLVPEGVISDYSPGSLIVIREKTPRLMNGNYVRAYGFADGHSEAVSREEVSQFEEFEALKLETAARQ